MFKQDVTTTYNLEDATYEIAIMLLVAFILGFLFRYFYGKKSTIIVHSDESKGLLEQLVKTQKELEFHMDDKAKLKKQITIDYSQQIDELKLRLNTARQDLEHCLENKALSVQSLPTPTNTISLDDLKIVEGIGPALDKLLKDAGISNLNILAESTEEKLRDILINAGSRFKVHDPSTWPIQASLATKGDWEALKKFQQKLNTQLD